MATITVATSGGDYTTVQAAIDAASRGDTIVITAGQTFTENITLPYKASGSGYVTIQSSALASLPTAGNRVAPSDASNMPTIRSTSAGATNVISAPSGSTPSQYYKLIGLNILRHNSTSQQTALVALGTSHSNIDHVPHNIIIDRCLIRGADNAPTRRGVLLNAKNSQVINSYIDNFWEDGADSQAILGTNGTQDVLIANNFLEAGSENILFGGSDPSITNFVPNNILVEHNYFFKRLAWVGDNTKHVKNLFETKNSRNLTIRNNIFENNWSAAQDGRGVHFSLRNQDGTAPWSVTENVTFEYNIIKNVGAGISFLLQDDAQTSGVQSNMTIRNNLVLINSETGMGWALLFVKGGSQTAQDITLDHNTFIHLSDAYQYGNRWLVLSGSSAVDGFNVTNSIVAGVTTNGSDIGRITDGEGGTGTPVVEAFATGAGYVIDSNIIQRGSSGMPTGNFYVASTAAIGFEDYAGGDYSLDAASNYKNDATDGTDPGVNWSELQSRTANVVAGTGWRPVGSIKRLHVLNIN